VQPKMQALPAPKVGVSSHSQADRPGDFGRMVRGAPLQRVA
jgi:hypothetical protein